MPTRTSIRVFHSHGSCLQRSGRSILFSLGTFAPKHTRMAEEEKALPLEGGVRGWLCALGAFFSLFATFGFLNAYVNAPGSLPLLTKQNWRFPDNLSSNNAERLQHLRHRLDLRLTTCSNVGTRSLIRSHHRHLRPRTSAISMQRAVCVCTVHDQSQHHILPDPSFLRTRFWHWSGRCLHDFHGLHGPVVCQTPRLGHRNCHGGE